MFSQVSIIHSVEGVSLVHVPSGYRVYTPPQKWVVRIMPGGFLTMSTKTTSLLN